MNEPLPFETMVEAEIAPTCEQCDAPFAPRRGTGGKPQRFCSADCRAIFHAQRKQRGTPHVGDVDGGGAEQRVLEPPPVPALKAATQSDGWDFDWSKNKDDIVVPGQPAIAVYFNPRGEVVIRQEGQHHPTRIMSSTSKSKIYRR